MRKSGLALLGILVALAAAAWETSVLAEPAASQSPTMIGGRRIGSPTPRRYGVGRDVLATVALVKEAGEERRLSSRAVRLPLDEYEPIDEFDYALPPECGGYTFRVYETARTQILEFAYSDADGAVFRIRDYVTGANPFIRPGLWGAYDHTADTIPYMRAELAENSAPPPPSYVYLKALVTGDSEPLQRELGMAYKRAVRAAVRCPTSSPLAALAR
jgi:hypothetical protein